MQDDIRPAEPEVGIARRASAILGYAINKTFSASQTLADWYARKASKWAAKARKRADNELSILLTGKKSGQSVVDSPPVQEDIEGQAVPQPNIDESTSSEAQPEEGTIIKSDETAQSMQLDGDTQDAGDQESSEDVKSETDAVCEASSDAEPKPVAEVLKLNPLADAITDANHPDSIAFHGQASSAEAESPDHVNSG